MSSNYCAMIHGGLNLVLKDPEPWIQACCLRSDYVPITISQPFWRLEPLEQLRKKNQRNEWDAGCFNCASLEQSGMRSFRQGMNLGLNTQGATNLSGPARIDLMFDISCNLACRTCGPKHSTFWQKHLKSVGEWNQPIFTPRKKADVIAALQTLDLTNLQQVVFCGGETLLGQEYWDVAQWLASQVPNAKDQLTLCFQTNGTQPINEANYKIIDSVHLVKLHVSIDGVAGQFDYLRWPATWSQVTDNLYTLRERVPSNVMFLIEQTVSVFNVLYLDQVDQWVRTDFATNREGDPVECTRHLANGIFSLDNLSHEYVELLQSQDLAHFVLPGWQEQPEQIKIMLHEISRFDQHRGQDIAEYFPTMYTAYQRFVS